MQPVNWYSTNNKSEVVNFETALLNGMASNSGLYMVERNDIPKLLPEQIRDMKGMPYSEIAFQVLNPFLGAEIPEKKLHALLDDAYREDIIPTRVQRIVDKMYVMWLTQGPTYSFKDYAMRFFGRALNHFLGERGLQRCVITATSGDTGGAGAAALHRLENVTNVIFYPKGEVSSGQRRQMTTLGDNIYAFEVNGDFDVCQALAKYLLANKEFAARLFGDPQHFTSANSISVGRLAPQAVYPFYAHSRIADGLEKMIVSVPSGNFGDMMGTTFAREMGLPIEKILVGLNPNKPFLDFIETGKYNVAASIKTPSSAMKVSHPSNLARLIDLYGGHMFDEKDPKTNKVIREGVIDRMPDLDAMREDFFVHSITNEEHYDTMLNVYEKYIDELTGKRVILDPHGAVGWRTLEASLKGDTSRLAVSYETADPGKFPVDVRKAIGITPDLPPGMKKQAGLEERIYSVGAEPDHKRDESGEDKLVLSDAQIREAEDKIRGIFS